MATVIPLKHVVISRIPVSKYERNGSICLGKYSSHLADQLLLDYLFISCFNLCTIKKCIGSLASEPNMATTFISSLLLDLPLHTLQNPRFVDSLNTSLIKGIWVIMNQ